MKELSCLWSRCCECLQLMYIDDAQVVYCGCEGFEPPAEKERG